MVAHQAERGLPLKKLLYLFFTYVHIHTHIYIYIYIYVYEYIYIYIQLYIFIYCQIFDSLFLMWVGTVTRIEGMFFDGRASGRAWVTFEEASFAIKALELDQTGYTNESCHTWMSHVTYEWVLSHMNESCRIWMSHVTFGWVISHMNELCHIWISHCKCLQWNTSSSTRLVYTNESCHIWMSHVTHEWVMSHM